MSPTQRTLAELRKLGFTAAIVEKWNPHAKVRQDLFGIIDIVAMRDGIGILGIQATTGTNHAARRDKSAAEPKLRTWLECGGRFEIWSWSKKGARGKRKLWELRREEIKGVTYDRGTIGLAFFPSFTPSATPRPRSLSQTEVGGMK